ncbi:Zn(2)-C6 fungal-type DNA-binding domain protein [Niveomyces insectorum RCEF 264]|uniref:Zn(2)-C6 fungal-type DNA-binding domain protein n=1 Tax=Niveomyces insectorum RCEF 264 TaxID=1081102 RepID=A0A167WD50_9HYPO|nr:Zn(2)-C6 fungal-type DNA-binding domain protein [Niveomyces insectorum RCEF 264]
MDSTELTRSVRGAAVTPGSDRTAKRRKVRKGTRSCWDCKHRKVRCTFASAEDAVCSNCRRRGAVCVSQDLPEELAPTRDAQMGDRIVRVEELVQDLAKKVTASSGAAFVDTPSASSSSSPVRGDSAPSYRDVDAVRICEAPLPAASDPSAPRVCRIVSSGPRDTTRIIEALVAALPSREDTDLICKTIAANKIYLHLLNRVSFGTLEREGLTPLRLPLSKDELINTATHPVLLAKNMLMMCIALYGLACKGINGLQELTSTIGERMFTAATNLVTNNEELHGTMECLECILYESVFHKNKGNLRRAWMAGRRALLVAQMMGLHQPRNFTVKALDPDARWDPPFMWFRIVYLDRYLCLLLGFPQGTLDSSMVAEAAMAADTPLGRLERRQGMIASRILERNEGGASNHDLAATQAIDAELLKLGKTMPAKFWLPPDFANIPRESDEEFWETARIASQVFFYNLLNQLHLPYLLRFDADGKYDYSKITCVNASREILTRFVAYRTYNKRTSCHRLLDFLALMAATTLLLAHFDSHLHRKVNNVFAHQRLADRAVMERVLDHLVMIGSLNDDALSEQGAQVLRCLLRIEDDAAEGRSYSARSVHRSDIMAEDDEDDRRHERQDENFRVLRICTPYFGNIRIAREGVVQQEPTPAASIVLRMQSVCDDRTRREPDPAVLPSLGIRSSDVPRQSSDQPQPPGESVAYPPQTYGSGLSGSELHGTNDGMTPLVQHDLPGMTAGIDDWAFQGVDMALFDTLMRGTSPFNGNDSGWAL